MIETPECIFYGAYMKESEFLVMQLSFNLYLVLVILNITPKINKVAIRECTVSSETQLFSSMLCPVISYKVFYANIRFPCIQKQPLTSAVQSFKAIQIKLPIAHLENCFFRAE
jgi:hypothetical protein